jgi:hypothetical protein
MTRDIVAALPAGWPSNSRWSCPLVCMRGQETPAFFSICGTWYVRGWSSVLAAHDWGGLFRGRFPAATPDCMFLHCLQGRQHWREDGRPLCRRLAPPLPASACPKSEKCCLWGLHRLQPSCAALEKGAVDVCMLERAVAWPVSGCAPGTLACRCQNGGRFCQHLVWLGPSFMV